MDQLEPDLDKSLKCCVCEDDAAGVHYGVLACRGCKNFFGRSLERLCTYKCWGSGNCQVAMGKKRKRHCPRCRFDKCVRMGMSKEAIKTGRYSVKQKTHYVQQAKRNQALDKLRPTGKTGPSDCEKTLPVETPGCPSYLQNDNWTEDFLIADGISRDPGVFSISNSGPPSAESASVSDRGQCAQQTSPLSLAGDTEDCLSPPLSDILDAEELLLYGNIEEDDVINMEALLAPESQIYPWSTTSSVSSKEGGDCVHCDANNTHSHNTQIVDVSTFKWKGSEVEQSLEHSESNDELKNKEQPLKEVNFGSVSDQSLVVAKRFENQFNPSQNLFLPYPWTLYKQIDIDIPHSYSDVFMNMMKHVLPLSLRSETNLSLKMKSLAISGRSLLFVHLKKKELCATLLNPLVQKQLGGLSPTMKQFQTLARKVEAGESPFVSDFDERELTATIEAAVKLYDTQYPYSILNLNKDEMKTIFDTCVEVCNHQSKKNPKPAREHLAFGGKMRGRDVLFTLDAISSENSIRKAVKFIKRVPGFKGLTQEDQIALVKGGVPEFCILSLYRGIDVERRCAINLEVNHVMCIHEIEKMCPSSQIEEVFRITAKLQRLNLTTLDIIILQVLAFLNRSTEGLRDVESVGKWNWKYINCLLLILHHEGRTSTFPGIVDGLVAIRSLLQEGIPLDFANQMRDALLASGVECQAYFETVLYKYIAPL